MKKETQILIKVQASFFKNLEKILEQPLTAYAPYFQNHYAIVKVAKVDLKKGTCTLRMFTTQNPNLSIPFAKTDLNILVTCDKFQAITIPYEIECPLNKLPEIENEIKAAAATETIPVDVLQKIQAFNKQQPFNVENDPLKLSQILEQQKKLDSELKPYLLESKTTVTSTTAQLINTKYLEGLRRGIEQEIIRYNKFGAFQAAPNKNVI